MHSILSSSVWCGVVLGCCSFLSESLAMLSPATEEADAGEYCSPSNSSQQKAGAAVHRSLTVKLPCSNRSAASRRAFGDSAAAAAGTGRVTGSRPSSSSAFRSSRRLRSAARESNGFGEVSWTNIAGTAQQHLRYLVSAWQLTTASSGDMLMLSLLLPVVCSK